MLSPCRPRIWCKCLALLCLLTGWLTEIKRNGLDVTSISVSVTAGQGELTRLGFHEYIRDIAAILKSVFALSKSYNMEDRAVFYFVQR